jgi:hypothetical protein
MPLAKPSGYVFVVLSHSINVGCPQQGLAYSIRNGSHGLPSHRHRASGITRAIGVGGVSSSERQLMPLPVFVPMHMN